MPEQPWSPHGPPGGGDLQTLLKKPITVANDALRLTEVALIVWSIDEEAARIKETIIKIEAWLRPLATTNNAHRYLKGQGFNLTVADAVCAKARVEFSPLKEKLSMFSVARLRPLYERAATALKAAAEYLDILAGELEPDKSATVRAVKGPLPHNPLPVGRYSPTKGVFIDRKEKAITITGRLELFGPEASTARAQSIESSINTIWTQRFSDGYKISCRISVVYRPPGTPEGNASQIEAVKIPGPSHVAGLIDREMTLNANEAEAFTWTAAHEFGHMLRLDDRYSESIVSKISGTYGGKRTSKVQRGYQNNIMAVHQGVLESRNLRDLIDETAPNWLQTDNRIRDWISNHKIGEIRKISTRNKISMIETLMSCWISREDLDAIVRIVSSVQCKDEAKRIRTVIDLADFLCVGQRLRARMAFDAMPD